MRYDLNRTPGNITSNINVGLYSLARDRVTKGPGTSFMYKPTNFITRNMGYIACFGFAFSLVAMAFNTHESRGIYDKKPYSTPMSISRTRYLKDRTQEHWGEKPWEDIMKNAFIWYKPRSV